MVEDVSNRDQLTQQRENVARWLKEIESKRARGTMLHGIAAKAVNQFEGLLRSRLQRCLVIADIDYDKAIRPDVGNKSVTSLTLGEMRQCLDKINGRVPVRLRSESQVLGERLRNRRFLSPADLQSLDRLVGLRNMLHHRSEEFASDFKNLEVNTVKTLKAIAEMLSSPLFELTSWIDVNDEPQAED